MPGAAGLKNAWRRLGRVERVFLFALLADVAAEFLLPGSLWIPLLRLAVYVLGAWAAIRTVRSLSKGLIWRLRNRLIVAYVFIAVIPIVLILVLAGLGVWMATTQVAVYLVTSELERRVTSLRVSARWISDLPARARDEAIRKMLPEHLQRFPGLEILVAGPVESRYPEDATIEPPRGWGEAHGAVVKAWRLYAWAHVVGDGVEVTLMAPLTSDTLSGMVPNLGEVAYRDLIEVQPGEPRSGSPVRMAIGKKQLAPAEPRREASREYLPPPANRFDLAVSWFSILPVSIWESPGQSQAIALQVRSRPSAVFNAVSARRADDVQGFLPTVFVAIAVAFLIVEIVSLIVGISLTRTITGAVHGLYEATRRVKEADFSHRIRVTGNDQLAELSHSFNSMTESLERLLEVAKEKERLQSELEIAREVQAQLYPKTTPVLKTLSLWACCNPARMVSGDYYDYQAVGQHSVALAIGDVAGKGISAALLMATVESSVRTQIRHCLDAMATAGGANGRHRMSTSRLVAQLNQQLYAYTSPEKYATFCFGVYDEQSGLLTYTNAGHLPPILIRRGQARLLEVNGIVVGAFPFSEWGETELRMESGDLLVCYTDGVTEPENEYGEMFGLERLTELLVKNADRDTEEIVASVSESVLQWTGTPDLQDDMTLLVARRI
jgi:sigma-B regulation protein RsbU (phosphoserine phosphatase)